MDCLLGFMGWIWPSVSGVLSNFFDRRAEEVLTMAYNWIVQRVRRTDSRVLQANFPQEIVGAEVPLMEIRRLLEDDDSTIIGIYGMGGVGKTTLLKTINDDYQKARSQRFDVVIFVTVSKVFLMDKIQEAICKKLAIESQFGQDTAGRASMLFNELRKKKFLILLDDLWDKLDLEAVGIPYPPSSKKGSKIAFTTRSMKVCNAMDAAQSKVKVCPLSPQKSWELFCSKLGKEDDQWTASTRPLAEAVAARCGGLPLALTVVGRAVADASSEREWEDALKTITETAAEFEEIKEEVLPILKFSFDRLKDEEHKECLLYCSLFPEDEDIYAYDLINYWIGEGLLGSVKCSMDIARKRGLAAINTLKSVSLLEVDNSFHCRVKLHDMVREMAHWITNGTVGKEKITFLVNSGEGLESAPVSERWVDATKISLMFNDIEELPESPMCANLRTLLLKHNSCLRDIPHGFFQFMPLLTVLDLSFTKIEFLPPEIGLLVDLRFLDLTSCPIESLPKELGSLKNLAILNLRETYDLKRIPEKAISSLSSLRVLIMSLTGFEWMGGWNGYCEEKGVSIEDLDSLKQLEEVTLGINHEEDLRGLLNSRKLCSVVRNLGLHGLSTSSIDWSHDVEDPKELRLLHINDCLQLKQMMFCEGRLRKLEYLHFWNLPLETISLKGDACFESLDTLEIDRCNSLKHITWIRHIPNLRELILIRCTKMEEIIEVEEANVNGTGNKRDSFFPRLEHIVLHDMPNLKTICTKILLFPSLVSLDVKDCQKLRKLPFGLDSAKNMVIIYAEREWLDGLEWDDQSIRSKFTSCFGERTHKLKKQDQEEEEEEEEEEDDYNDDDEEEKEEEEEDDYNDDDEEEKEEEDDYNDDDDEEEEEEEEDDDDDNDDDEEEEEDDDDDDEEEEEEEPEEPEEPKEPEEEDQSINQ